MNNLSQKINQNAEEIYRTNNSMKKKSSSKLSSIFNKKNDNLVGGTNAYKICMTVLNAFNNNNIKLALSTIMENLSNEWVGQDDNGNTILHHLVLCINRIKDCKR